MKKITMKRRQITRMSMQRKIIISSFCFILVAGGFFFSINVSNIQNTMASAEGDYRTVASGNWEDVAIWESYDGSKWHHTEKAPQSISNKIIIQKGNVILINSELTISNLFIEKGAYLQLNSPAFHLKKQNSRSEMNIRGTLDANVCIIDGDGIFTLDEDAILFIGSKNGIAKSAASGNVQVSGARNFSKYATYHYRSPDKQFAGKGLPTEVSSLVVENPFELELENNVTVTTSLVLKSGIISTASNTLTLGTATTSLGILTRETGSVKGTFKRWLGPGSMKDILFPLSDGKNYNALFMSANKDDYEGGTFTLSFSMDKGKGMMDDGNARVLFASENGSYAIIAADGLNDGLYKMLSTAAISVNENKSYWQMNARSGASIPKLEAPTAGTDNVSEIVVWPNPFTDNFKLKFNLAQSAEINADLYSAAGQLIHHELINGEDRTNEVQFNDLSSLAPGIYILNITEGGKLVTSKRVVKG